MPSSSPVLYLLWLDVARLDSLHPDQNEKYLVTLEQKNRSDHGRVDLARGALRVLIKRVDEIVKPGKNRSCTKRIKRVGGLRSKVIECGRQSHVIN